jgi:hypothetical protein
MAKMIKTEPPKRSLIASPIRTEPVNLDSIEAMTREKDRPVTGTFINIECPGQTAKVCAKLYKGMDYFEKVFMDNEKATIPLSVARFINERCYHDRHKYLTDGEGNPVKSNTPQYRYKFNIEQYA